MKKEESDACGVCGRGVCWSIPEHPSGSQEAASRATPGKTVFCHRRQLLDYLKYRELDQSGI